MSEGLSQYAEQVLEIMPVIHREFLKAHAGELSRGRFTIPQMIVLALIDKRRRCRMTEVARFLDVSTAAVTGLINRLVKAGYVNRIFDDSDRRIINVGLTAKGSHLAQKIHDDKHRMIQRIFGTISAAERKQYLNILTHIHDVLQKERGRFAQ